MASNRLADLQQYMEFYQKNHLGPQMNTTFMPSSPMNADLYAPVVGANGSSGTAAADWAAKQMAADSAQNRPEMPDFFGGDQAGQPMAPYQKPQYTSPPNPYDGRTTNYLRQLLQGNPDMMRRGSTVGIRG